MKGRKITLETLENWMLNYLQTEKLQNLAVAGVGTIYIKKETSVKVADWSVTLPWIQRNERWDMLNHAVNKTVVVQYIADNDEPPPGVSHTVVATVGLLTERAKA